MATQPHILSFDEAKRDTRTRRPSAVAPEDRPRIHTIDSIPAFESPFRQSGSGQRSAASASRTRTAGSSRRPASASVAPERAARSSSRRPADRPAASRPATGARRASDPYGVGRFAIYDERADEPGDERVEERRLSRSEKRKKERAKGKADRAFSKQFGGLNQDSDASQAGPRAVLYKGEMGSKQRQAARMQNAASPQASSKRRFSPGSVASLKSSPKFIASTAVALCLVLSCLFLYPTAQQYYHAMRERDQLAAEYAALAERNGALQSDVASLQTDAGIEDRAHEQFGWVKKGEETANVRGLDLDESESSSFRANITPGSIEAPETWYSPFLDMLFGVE